MLTLPVLTSFIDKPIIAGYSLRSIFEYWWIGLIVFIVAIVGALTAYFLLAWLFGRMKFKEGDKETIKQYKQSDRKTKKEMAKTTQGPAKNVITWKRSMVWIIPVACVMALIVAPAAAFLPSTAFANLLITLSGSHVRIVDSPASIAAAKEAEKNVVTIQEEGTVLLKNTNNSLPLKAKEGEEKIKVNIFGACAYGLFYGNGGSGSFQTDGRYSNFPRVAKKLEVAMQENGFEINDNLYNMIKNYYNNKSVSIAPSNYDIQCGYNKYNYSEIVPSKAPYDNEPNVSVYDQSFSELGGKSLLQNAKEFSENAIFCITRRGSEDEDMNYTDLKLRDNERAVIEKLEENFDNVIILLNVPTVIEASFLNDERIDSAIFMGHPGLTGTTAVAEILAGTINPSGRLVDTWPYDVTSAPSYQNFGNDSTTTYTSGAARDSKFVNYAEGIYVGYRYYVTRAKVDPSFNYNDYVQYSFGHGLSYTTFDKSILDFDLNAAKQTFNFNIEVTNTGSVPGKEVIQLYVHAPYKSGGIEKAWYSLCAFAKTSLLNPGDTKIYHLEVTYRDIASWDTSKGYYVLENGDYEFSLRENVWDEAATTTGRSNTKTYNMLSGVEFKTSYQTGKQYKNLFEDVEWGGSEDKITYLSRSDFAGTLTAKENINLASAADKDFFPGGPENAAGGISFAFEDNQINEPQPLTGQANGLTLRDLKDANWDDTRWESLLDQLSTSDLEKLVDGGSFKTEAVASIGKKATNDYDGPSAAYHSGTGHPSEVTLACTWNEDMGRLMGESIGREGASRQLTGWYAPGINTHRSPFGGRNFEYYSEDPLIAGRMAGNTTQGSMKYGVYTYAKHFILNDQENSRAGVLTWVNEQALREIYARGFEIYVDMGGIGIMSSFNCVGSWWAGGSKALLTDLLREEWGFHGVVVTDYAGPDYMATNIGLRAGNDLWLNKASYSASDTRGATKNDGLILLRRAAKNILYACAHSNNVWDSDDFEAVGIEAVQNA